jgi:hypothetical protein
MVAKDGFMPPYPPTGDSPAYSNLTPLRSGEIDLLARWVAGGSKPGDEASSPATPDFEAWALGEPDLVLEASDELEIPPDAVDLVRNFVLPVPVTATRWIRAVALWPGAAPPQRALAWLTDAERAESVRADEPDSVLGLAGDLEGGLGFGPPPAYGGEHLPIPAVPYPEGTARRVDPGGVLVLQTVFQGSGEPRRARSRVGVYFAESAPSRPLITVPVGASDLLLPAGEVTTIVRKFDLPVAARIEGVLPIAHRLATRIRSWASLPDGSERTLVEIAEWDLAWTSAYWLAEPIELPAGASLAVEIVYDNTQDNIHQIHFPPKDVGWGLSPADELAAVDVMLSLAEDDVARLAASWQAWTSEPVGTSEQAGTSGQTESSGPAGTADPSR